MKRAALVLLGLSATPSLAEDQPASAEVAPLLRYLGDWSYEGKDATPVTGGVVTCEATRRLISGGYFVESHRECRTPRGVVNQVEVFGFDYQRRVYVYWGFNGRGVSTYETPTIDAATVWSGTGFSRGNRCTEVFSDDLESSTDECETTTDGGTTWVLVASGKSSKRR
jgi:hypothetical protein